MKTIRQTKSASAKSALILTIALSVLLMVLTACNAEQQDETQAAEIGGLAFEYAMEQAERRRANITRAVEDDAIVEAIMQIVGNVNPDFNLGWYGRLNTMRHADYVGLDDAIFDIGLLYAYLTNAYFGRILFDESLLTSVFSTIVEEVRDFAALNDDTIDTEHMLQVLHSHLSDVIHDGRAALGFQYDGRMYNFNRPHTFYTSDMTFERTSDGVRNAANGRYVTALDGVPVSELLALTLNAYGEIHYGIVVSLAGDVPIIYHTLSYADGDTEEIRLVSMSATIAQQTTGITHVYGISVITIADMAEFMPHPGEDLLLELFGESTIIIDLRGSMGEDLAAARNWLEGLVDARIPSNAVLLRRETNEMFVRDNAFSVTRNMPREVVEHDRRIVILTDRNTRSGAEFFLDLTTNLTNTIIVGTNTAGNMTILESDQVFRSGTGHTALMNSGITINFGGDQILLWPEIEGHFAESIGIEPDIWVHGDALSAAVAMLRNAGYAGYIND